MGGTTISVTVQTLIESGCLSRCALLFDQDLALDISGISGQLQHDESSDGGENNSSLRILNAVKLSLMLTRTFFQCYNDRKNDSALASLRMDGFVVKLQYSPNADEEDGETSRAGDEHIQSISSVDQFNTITSNGLIQWILLDMDVKYSDVRIPSTNMNIAILMQNVGKLLYAIFSQNDAPAPEAQYSNGDKDKGIETTRRSPKTRRSASTSLFQQLIELGYPISVCRLLSDLIDGGTTHHPITSFDDIIRDLEQMNSHPHIFLHNPENEFYASSIHFGQRYNGRSKELAKLLEITTVPNERNFGLETIFVSGTDLYLTVLPFWYQALFNIINFLYQVWQGVAR